MFIQVGIFLIVVHKMAKGGLLALHTQQVLVSGQHDVPGQKPKTNLQQALGLAAAGAGGPPGGPVATSKPEGMEGAQWHVAKELESLNFPTVNVPHDQPPLEADISRC